MLEFRVNQYITLKLERNDTVIYVNGERFNQCKFLLLNIPIEKSKDFNEIESIDEAAEKLDQTMKDALFFSNEEIPPEIKFWAHCSNLQVWVENEYNTKLLHSSLAFPLLKKLTGLGDSFAKIKLQEEIIKRLESGCFSIVEFLISGGYLTYLTEPKLAYSFLESEQERTALDHLNKVARYKYNNDFELVKRLDFFEDERDYPPSFFIVIKDKHIIGLDIHCNQLEEFPKSIFKLTHLKKLYLDNNKISIIPDDIGELKSLVDLSLSGNVLTNVPHSIRKLKSLKNLGLERNELKEFPDVFEEYCSLENIYLSFNHLDRIPESISKCRKLKQLHLGKNNLTSIPSSFSQLKSVDWINLEGNSLNEKHFETLRNKSIYKKITF